MPSEFMPQTALAITICLFLCMAVTGLSCINVRQLRHYAVGGSVFHLLLPRQYLPLGLWLEALRFAACLWLAWLALGQAPETARPALLGTGAILALLCVLSAFLVSLSIQLARARKPGAAVVLAALGALGNLALLVCATAVCAPLFFGLIPLAEPFSATLPFQAILHWPASAWVLLIWLVPASPAAGAALLLTRLLQRRNNDNFGRDYYSFASRFSARVTALWAALCTLPGLALVCLLVARPALGAGLSLTGPETRHSAAWAAATLLLPLLAALLLRPATRSTTPLRHKVSFTLAPLLLLLATVALCFMLRSLLIPAV